MQKKEMLTGIKKILTSLGFLCVFLIVIEEIFQQTHTKIQRPSSERGASEVEYVRYKQLNISTSPTRHITNSTDQVAMRMIDEGNKESYKEIGLSLLNLETGNTTTMSSAVQGPESELNQVVKVSNSRSGRADSKTDGDAITKVSYLTDAIAVSEIDQNALVKVSTNTVTTTASNKEIDKIPSNRGTRTTSVEDLNETVTILSNGGSERKDSPDTELDNDNENKKLRLSPYIYHKGQENNGLSPSSSKSAVKLVSFYLPWDLARLGVRRFRGCEYSNCKYVNNMSKADAVLFRASQIRDHIIPNFYRPKNQRWIFFTSDPAVKMYSLDRPDVISNFNWTITYQLDSDFPTPFGLLSKRQTPSRDFEAVYNKKSREVAWFVSHCKTWGRRELYVERMRKIIPVDIFGKCGNMTCGPIHYRGNDSTECLPMLTDHYKFYLAFENSFCKDYISEKFFKLFQDVDVIPVVRGGFDYKKYLPSHIFVDSSDFKTPEDLANYLVQLGNNKQAYIGMLKRKSQWLEVSPMPFQCRLCKVLHTAESGSYYHQNLKDKFNGNPPYCWQPTDLGALNVTS